MSRKDDRIAWLENEIDRVVADQSRTWDMNNNQLSMIEGLAVESDDRARELDRYHAAIEAAIADLRNLQEVPAGDLFQSVGEIVGTLRAVIV